MTSRVGPKGQVVIPQQVRAELGIQPGDEVELWRDGDHVAVRLVQPGRPLLGGYVGEPLTDVMAPSRPAPQRALATKDR